MSLHHARASSLDPPRFRGVLHTWCFFASIPAGIALVITAPTGRAAFAAWIFAYCMAAMFGVSALFHRTAFDDHAWARFRRLDHVGIYLAIAGGFTPLGMLALDGWAQNLMLIGGWVGMAVGAAMRFAPFSPPYGFMNAMFITIGWIPIITLTRLWDSLGTGWMVLILLGGALYTGGAFIVGSRWPDPDPKVFGYHEIWHLMVALAGTLHYIAIAFGVLPLAG